MRDAIKTLAKAAVTALIKSDPSALAIEGGKVAIDTLLGWLPQKGKLEALIARVEGELEQLADAEFKGRADLDPARGLSLGDRACLALARRLGASVLTADRAWQGLDPGVSIELIR